jgi:hypothetical protein
MTTYFFHELDAIARCRAIRYYNLESGNGYERNWDKVFAGWKFYCDGSRAVR